MVGPERPTLIERFIGVFHLPYLVGCLPWAFLMSLFSSVAGNVEPLGPAKAFEGWVTSFVQVSNNSIIIVLLMFYLLYAPHYVRMRIVQAKESIAPLLLNREEEFHRLFGRISALRPHAVVWLVISLLFLTGLNPGFPSTLGLSFPLPNILFIVLALLISSVIWTYYASLRGIDQMGTAQLQLRPYFKDRMLGLRPVGRLSLSIATAYFLLIGFLLISILVSPAPLVIYALILGLTLLGVLMFFLPLRRLHGRMLEQKKLERAGLEDRLGQLYQNPVETRSSTDISELFMLDMRERRISSIATWPFDTGIIIRLSAIIISVVAILLSKVIAGAIGIGG